MVDSDKHREEPKNIGNGRNDRPGVDIVSAVFIMVLSILVTVYAFQLEMPRGVFSAPGLLPIFLAVCLFLMALALLVSALKNDGARRLVESLRGARSGMRSVKFTRSASIIAVSVGYAILLTLKIPFEVATTAYLLTCFRLFWRQGRLGLQILIAVVTPIVFTVVFRVFFSIFMPGESLWEYIINYI